LSFSHREQEAVKTLPHLRPKFSQDCLREANLQVSCMMTSAKEKCLKTFEDFTGCQKAKAAMPKGN
jgi:hypothetical protein